MQKYLTMLKILTVCLIACVCLYIGINIGQKDVKDDAVYSTNIAVINQDIGVFVGGESINYANSIIEILGKNYTVVSPAVAQTGIENGTYGAIVTFPSDFSANLVSINELNPKQAVLGLSINHKLPEEQYISLYTQLMNMQHRVNNNIAYAYVKTVYTQLHEAQDEIDTLLDNDDKDMDAIEKVTLKNYAEMIDCGDLPNIQFEAESADFTDFINSSKSVANNMDLVITIYTDAQVFTKNNTETVRQYTDDVRNSSEQWKTEMEDWGNTYSQGVKEYREKLLNWREDEDTRLTVLENYGNNLKVNNGYLDEYKGGLKTWANNIINELKNIKSNAKKSSQLAGELKGKVETYNSKVDTCKDKVIEINKWLDYAKRCKNYYEDGIGDKPLIPSDTVPYMNVNDEDKVNQATINELESIITQSDGNFKALKEKLAPVEEKKPKLSDKYKKPQPIDDFRNSLPTVNEMQELSKDPIPDSSKLVSELEKLFNNLNAFRSEIDQKFSDETKEKVKDAASGYDKSVSDVTAAMESANNNNLSVLNELYMENTKYVSDLTVTVHEIHEREQEALSKSIDELEDTMKKTSKSNHSIMNSFVSRMPNSRKDSSVNDNVVETTIEPITYSNSYLRDKETAKKNDYNKWFIWTFALLLLAIAADSIMLLRSVRVQKASVEHE